MAMAIPVVMLTTIGLFAVRVIGLNNSQSIWSSSQVVYQAVDQWLDHFGDEGQRIAINNPPGFFVASGRESIVIPDGGPEVLRQVIDRYRVDWLVLDRNNSGLAELYENPDLLNWLIHEDTLEPIPGSVVQIYRVVIE